uniref:Discoidin, CUB and LCCL domain containing 1 n=1 Tax=Pavo cristatus TaxID=9049 RepID=A0A8C9ER34_PAVCR
MSAGGKLGATPLLCLHLGDGCGHTVLTAQSGTLSSRNYPGTYPNHTACHWELQAPPGTSLIVAFGDVDLESSERCTHSSLLLADPESGTTYGPYCRNAVPTAPLLVTNSSAVTVLFNSTSHRSGRGLLLSYASSEHPGREGGCPLQVVYCPAGCKDIEGDIWGNTKEGYRDTSVLCKAAVHAGVVADEAGGQVTLSREKGITLYESAFANGLHSKRWLSPHLAACGDALEVRSWAAEQAALGTPSPSWAAEPGADTAWLELDLGTRRNVTGIITKGSAEIYDFYVTSYRVSSSRDGKNWRPYRGSSGREDKVFEGNVDSLGEVSNAFIPPITTRYLRITPQSWHQRAALKVALLGCQMARVRAARPYGEHLSCPWGPPAPHAPSADSTHSTLLVMLLIGVFVLLSSSLLLLAFLCRRRRWVPACPPRSWSFWGALLGCWLHPSG